MKATDGSRAKPRMFHLDAQASADLDAAVKALRAPTISAAVRAVLRAWGEAHGAPVVGAGPGVQKAGKGRPGR